MPNEIEFYEIPDECNLTVQFAKGVSKRFNCRTDISHGNVITEVYDNSGEIIATSIDDLRALGATKVTLEALHEIEI